MVHNSQITTTTSYLNYGNRIANRFGFLNLVFGVRYFHSLIFELNEREKFIQNNLFDWIVFQGATYKLFWSLWMYVRLTVHYEVYLSQLQLLLFNGGFVFSFFLLLSPFFSFGLCHIQSQANLLMRTYSIWLCIRI